MKTETFISTLEGDPEKCIAKMISYHKVNREISRYKKFKHYFNKINPFSDIEKNTWQAIRNFADIVHERLITCDYIPGVMNFIKNLKAKGLSLFVVSGSDRKELEDIFKKRGIFKLFSAIYGSPTTKIENMNKVIKKIGAQKQGIYFGDSKLDLDAAEQFGLDFIFVKGVSEWREGSRLTRIKGFLTIKDFKEEAWTEF